MLGGFSLSFLGSLALLALTLGAGIAAILSVRRRLVVPSCSAKKFSSGNGRGRMGESGRGDWESTLAGYKNLRDEGVLSEEEYRKIRTLGDPHVRTVVPELRPQHWPPTDPAGPEHTRDTN